MEEDAYYISSMALDAYDSTILCGIHGFLGKETETPFPIIKSRVVTNLGYLTRKEVIDKNAKLLEPTSYIDTYFTESVYDDNTELAYIKAYIQALRTISDMSAVHRLLYHGEPLLHKIMRNKGTKRIRSNRKEIDKLYKLVDDNNIKLIFAIDINAAPRKGVKNSVLSGSALLMRAATIRELCYESTEVPFNVSPTTVISQVDGYWKSNIDIPPLLGFKETVYYTRDIANTPSEYYMVNRGKDFINIGRKAEFCGYSYVKLTKPSTTLSYVRELVSKFAPKEPTLVALRVDTIRVNPGLILADLMRFGNSSIHVDRELGTITTMHDKLLATYALEPAMTLKGLDILNHLKNVLKLYQGDDYNKANYKIISTEDITDQFVAENDKGVKIPTPELKDSKGFMKIKVNKKRRHLMLGSELLERNMLVKMIKQNLKVVYVVFKVTGEEVPRIAYVVSTTEGTGIYNNWYVSVII